MRNSLCKKLARLRKKGAVRKLPENKPETMFLKNNEYVIVFRALLVSLKAPQRWQSFIVGFNSPSPNLCSLRRLRVGD